MLSIVIPARNESDNLKDMLDIKKIQFYYYTINRDSLIQVCNNTLKKIERDNINYNDILNISSSFSFYTDTDSCYVTLDKMVELHMKDKSQEEIIDILDKFTEDKLVPAINGRMAELGDYMNVHQLVVFLLTL